MSRWLICLFFIGIMVSQDDGLAPNFVYLEPIEDFFSREPVTLEIIITDRNEIDQVSLFYRFDKSAVFTQQEMKVSSQPVIYNVEIPLDEVESGFIQYFFWAKDEYGNEATWPSGGEDLPIVLPIYPAMQKKIKEKEEKPVVIAEGVQLPGVSPPDLEDNLPYYIEIGMLAPANEIKQEEGVPIIVLSIFDPEFLIDLESVKLLIDSEIVSSFNSPDMITYIPLDPFDPGYHIVHYESNNKSGEILIKEFAFFILESIVDDSAIEKISWKDKIKLKGDLGWNIDFDPAPNKPIDSHKFNSSVKFQLGDYKFNFSGLTNTHLYDSKAREETKHRQPSTRLKFKMESPHLNLYYGDNSQDFSDFSLKGTRVRGVSAKFRRGTWETSFVSGETKHLVDNVFNQLLPWDSAAEYEPGDQIYHNGMIFEKSTSTPGSPDTLNWNEIEESDYSIVKNDECYTIEPTMYGVIPDNGISDHLISDTLAYWSGEDCVEIHVYSKINMMTGKDGIEEGYLFNDHAECLQKCKTPIIYQKGFTIRQLQGFRTSKDYYEHAKFGISAIRSWDVRDTSLVPYSIFDEYTYEGNLVVATDFVFHFNHDKTVLSGEYGLSMTIDQTFPDTLLLRSIHNVPEDKVLYNYAEWEGVDYCYQNQCIDINGDGNILSTPEFVEGVIMNDSLWEEISLTRKKLNNWANILGFSVNDDINGYAEGRGISGLTGPEVNHLVNGGLDSIYLLLKRPAFKVIFKTPIPIYFTELDFQTEFNQAPLNYLSHGSSSIQTDVRNWKNKTGFKLLKNQLSFSFGYDKQIKSPWNPESALDGTIKRSITDTKSGSIGLSFRKLPAINYSIRLQDREDMTVNMNEGTLNHLTTGLKTLSTHTIAPTYKLKLGKTNINLNGNITLVNDLDLLTDTTGCYEILNSTAGEKWGGEIDTNSCGNNGNIFLFTKTNNPLRDSGNSTTTYTSALSFSFSFPLSLNLGWGLSTNSPNDLRQSATVITVYSTKLGYKLLDNNLNVTIGGNYVVGIKRGNGFWDSGEILVHDNNNDGSFNQNDEFTDKIELDNNKLTLKGGLQYKIPEDQITIGLNLDYSQATDNLVATKEEPTFKAKMTIKYVF